MWPARTSTLNAGGSTPYRRGRGERNDDDDGDDGDECARERDGRYAEEVDGEEIEQSKAREALCVGEWQASVACVARRGRGSAVVQHSRVGRRSLEEFNTSRSGAEEQKQQQGRAWERVRRKKCIY
jgi:hypothetical protein